MPMEVGERDLKTSHVTVYLANRIKGGHLTIFKNISCYSLSIKSFYDGSALEEFKNISCYSLSSVP